MEGGREGEREAPLRPGEGQVSPWAAASCPPASCKPLLGCVLFFCLFIIFFPSVLFPSGPRGSFPPPRGMQRGAPAGPAAADPAAGSPRPPREGQTPASPAAASSPALPPCKPWAPSVRSAGGEQGYLRQFPRTERLPKSSPEGRFGKQLFGNVTKAATKQFPHKVRQLCSAEIELTGTTFNTPADISLGKHIPCFVQYLGFVFISIQHHFCTKLTPGFLFMKQQLQP